MYDGVLIETRHRVINSSLPFSDQNSTSLSQYPLLWSSFIYWERPWAPTPTPSHSPMSLMYVFSHWRPATSYTTLPSAWSFWYPFRNCYKHPGFSFSWCCLVKLIINDRRMSTEAPKVTVLPTGHGESYISFSINGHCFTPLPSLQHYQCPPFHWRIWTPDDTVSCGQPFSWPHYPISLPSMGLLLFKDKLPWRKCVHSLTESFLLTFELF